MSDTIKKYVVEDNEVHRELIDSIFKLHGISDYKIFENFTELREVLHGKPPEVLILDYYVKNETAFDLLSELKKVCPHTHLIIMSAQVSMKILVDVINTHMRLTFIDKTDNDFKDKLVFFIKEVCGEIIECRKQEEIERKRIIQEWEEKREAYHKLKFHPHIDDK